MLTGNRRMGLQADLGNTANLTRFIISIFAIARTGLINARMQRRPRARPALPGFLVELDGVTELHAAFREESRT